MLWLSDSFVGVVLLAARFFDAFIDPFLGVLVAKTRTRWGRFRPWIFSGTLLIALGLFALFGAPVLDEAALMVYFSVVYILWGVTYTMMDIPYWSMIPAVTRTPKDRENLSMVGRTCAGVGSALIAMFTMLLVGILGGDSERAGFRWVALIVSVLFVVTELVCCAAMQETTPSEMKTATVKEMFSALFRNDQAMVVVGSIVLINSALYLTSNFIIYFFKYDLGGAGWKATYTLFSTVGGAAQILGMMVLYPLLRKKFSSTQVFHLSLVLALVPSIIATVLGTLATLGINSMSRKSQRIINNISYVPVVNPEIITGVSLMLLFVMAQNFGIGGESGIFGWPTLLIAHITFNIPYVIFNVGPKLRQLDPSLYNAALDLGCTPRQAFTKVIMPQLSPAILSAFLICLTYSIDDFMISYFNSGTMQTLPIAIYSMTRKKVSPEINALSAVIFCVILAIILISNAADSRAYRRNQKAIRKAMLDEGGR